MEFSHFQGYSNLLWLKKNRNYDFLQTEFHTEDDKHGDCREVWQLI